VGKRTSRPNVADNVSQNPWHRAS